MWAVFLPVEELLSNVGSLLELSYADEEKENEYVAPPVENSTPLPTPAPCC